MKSSRFFITALFSSLAVAFFTMVSCDKSGPDQDEEQDVLEGNSIMVAKTANSTAVFTLDMADSCRMVHRISSEWRSRVCRIHCDST